MAKKLEFQENMCPLHLSEATSSRLAHQQLLTGRFTSRHAHIPVIHLAEVQNLPSLHCGSFSVLPVILKINLQHLMI